MHTMQSMEQNKENDVFAVPGLRTAGIPDDITGDSVCRGK